jgi:hypothetical protein
MNTSRNTESQIPSPATGTRARLGHVVRWHAEPVSAEVSRETRESAEAAETRNHTASALPL